MKDRTWRDRIWMAVAGALAVAYAVTFTIGQFRGSAINHNAAAAVVTVQTETKYLGEVATYANYLALIDRTVCNALHITCPAPPSFPDPPGLPPLR